MSRVEAELEAQIQSLLQMLNTKPIADALASELLNVDINNCRVLQLCGKLFTLHSQSAVEIRERLEGHRHRGCMSAEAKTRILSRIRWLDLSKWDNAANDLFHANMELFGKMSYDSCIDAVEKWPFVWPFLRPSIKYSTGVILKALNNDLPAPLVSLRDIRDVFEVPDNVIALCSRRFDWVVEGMPLTMLSDDRVEPLLVKEFAKRSIDAPIILRARPSYDGSDNAAVAKFKTRVLWARVRANHVARTIVAFWFNLVLMPGGAAALRAARRFEVAAMEL